MKRNWPELFSRLTPGLSIKEAARQLHANYRVVYYHAHRNRYPFTDGRHAGQNHRRLFDPDKVDWTKTDDQIARDILRRDDLRISRQRINFLRLHRSKRR